MHAHLLTHTEWGWGRDREEKSCSLGLLYLPGGTEAPFTGVSGASLCVHHLHIDTNTRKKELKKLIRLEQPIASKEGLISEVVSWFLSFIYPFIQQART